MHSKLLEFLQCPSCNSTSKVVCERCFMNLETGCQCVNEIVDDFMNWGSDAEMGMQLYCTECDCEYEKDFHDAEEEADKEAEEAQKKAQPTLPSFPELDGVLGDHEDWWDEAAIPTTGPPPPPLKKFPPPGGGSGKTTTVTGGTGPKKKPKGKTKTTTYNYQKCRHYPTESSIEIADGVTVYPSSMFNERKETEFWPDFGLYADKGWTPQWRNEFIVFPDYGIPKYPIAVTQITSAACRAADLGQKVEFGCIGGHGRTGTILACMKVWGAERDGNPITPEDAVKWVRSKYCHEAIETEMQEWWVSYYAHIEFGYELPEKPVTKVKYSAANSGCSVRSHTAMYVAGADRCLAKDHCGWWEKDLEAANFPSEATLKDLTDHEVAKWIKVIDEEAKADKEAKEKKKAPPKSKKKTGKKSKAQRYNNKTKGHH